MPPKTVKPIKPVTKKSPTPNKEQEVKPETAIAKAEDTQKPQWLIDAEKEASEMAASAGGDYLSSISTLGAKFTADGVTLKSPLKLVILQAAKGRGYYTDAWKNGAKSTPICFAYGEDEDACVPHPESADRQNEDCKSCPHNAWGSGGEKAKACKTRVKLAVVVPTNDSKSLVEAEIKTLSIPTGTLKKWRQYLGSLAMVTPLLAKGVVTEVGFDTNGGGFGLTFKAVEKLSAEFVEVLQKRTAGLREKLTQPYRPPVEEAAPVPTPKGKRKF